MINILVVDDEPDIGDLYRQQFRKELRQGQLQLFVAHSGQEALKMLEEINHLQPLVIFSDINMPGMNGIDLLKEIKSRWPAQKTILVSAYAGNDDFKKDAAAFMADDFLSKPIDFEELRSRFSEMES